MTNEQMTNEELIRINRYRTVYYLGEIRDRFDWMTKEEKQALTRAIEAINKERPKGEWIIVKDEKWGDNVKCPFCGKELAGTDLNFYCKCGAELIGSEKMNMEVDKCNVSYLHQDSITKTDTKI